MALEIKDLVEEMYELRLLITAWGEIRDPELEAVLEQMRLRVRSNLVEVAKWVGARRRIPTVH